MALPRSSRRGVHGTRQTSLSPFTPLADRQDAASPGFVAHAEIIETTGSDKSQGLCLGFFVYNSHEVTPGFRMNTLAALYRPSLALLTDLYELTMAYGYWKVGMSDAAVFHLVSRNPFGSGFRSPAA